MGSVFYLIESFFVIGIIGTAFANRRADTKIRKERWLKLIVHFFIVHVLVIYILYFSDYFYLLAITILLVGFYEIIKNISRKQQTLVFYGFVFIIFILLALGFYLATKNFSSSLLLYIFMIVFVFDGFSQISGQVFGKRLLFPKVSPGKTLEGLAGGALATILTSIFIHQWILATISESIYFCLLLIISSVLGDWLASYLKRKQGIKDYSQLIPGHGGILDRFDSWIAACAIAYFAIFYGMFDFLYNLSHSISFIFG